MRVIDPVHWVIWVPEQGVGEAGLEEVHREEGGDSDDLVEEDVDTLPVPDILPRALLTQPQQAGRGQGQELLQSVLDVIVTSKVVFIFFVYSCLLFTSEAEQTAQ